MGSHRGRQGREDAPRLGGVEQCGVARGVSAVDQRAALLDKVLDEVDGVAQEARLHQRSRAVERGLVDVGLALVHEQLNYGNVVALHGGHQRRHPGVEDGVDLGAFPDVGLHLPEVRRESRAEESHERTRLHLQLRRQLL